MSSSVIQVTDTVVVKSVTDKCCYVVKVNGDQKLGKSRVSMREAVGEPYTAYFELNGRKLKRADASVDVDEAEADDDGGGAAENGSSDVRGQPPEDPQQHFNSFTNQDIQHYLESIEKKNASVTGIRGDNSFYVDTNTAQKLTTADINKLRESGLSGADIIKTLIENSDTFAYKTDFAQEKWIKRKEQKYRRRYQVLQPTPLAVCEAAFTKNKDKISNMRFDTLAQVLSQAGVYAGCHVMVIDSTVGLVTGSVAYRMRGHGRVLSVYGSQQPHLDIAKQFNLSPSSLDIIEPVPAEELGPAAKYVALAGFLDHESFALPEASQVTTTATSGQTLETNAEVVGAPAEQGEEESATAADDGQSTGKKRKQPDTDHAGQRPGREPSAGGGSDQLSSTGRSPEAQARIRSYLRQGVDRLIIASRFRPLPLLKVALYLLAPSSSFVVYHEFMEPLVECFLYLQEHSLAIKLSLSDTWMREFQTLPGRTRPDMFMSTSGGYLLTGIYVGMLPRPFLPTTATNEI
eukprot:gene26114-31532_t